LVVKVQEVTGRYLYAIVGVEGLKLKGDTIADYENPEALKSKFRIDMSLQ
jgi:hypothetical protein